MNRCNGQLERSGLTPATERRLLQMAVAAAALVPLSAGLAGVVQGAQFLLPAGSDIRVDLDSHLRYLSGLLLGIGIAFCWMIPRIERNGRQFRTLGAIVVLGGLARLLSLVILGEPSAGHRFGLAMELGVVPLLMLWQTRLERRWMKD